MAVIFRPMRLPPGTFMVTFFYQQRECEVCGKIEQEEFRSQVLHDAGLRRR